MVLPVLMVGSMFFWSLAIGLGGLSLMVAGSMQMVPGPNDDSVEMVQSIDVADTIGPGSITIHLEESAEPEDVNDNSGAAGFPASAEDDQAVATPGPGLTSY